MSLLKQVFSLKQYNYFILLFQHLKIYSGLDIQAATIQIYQNHYPEIIYRVFIINGLHLLN